MINSIKEKIAKRKPIFLIAGVALFLGVLPMPYGYYQLLRWFICGVGAYGAYLSYEKENVKWAWILCVIALVSNPFVKFYLGIEGWKMVDLIVGVVFCVYFKKNEK